MKKGLIFSLITISLISMGIVWHSGGFETENKKFSKIKLFGEEEGKDNPAKRAMMSAARLKYEFKQLRNPKTGKIPKNIYQDEMKQAMSLPISGEMNSQMRNGVVRTANGLTSPTTNTYLAAGPTNVGGRTKALAFDVRYNGTSNQVILSGSVSGGIMRSADGGATWNLVNPDKQTHSLTCLAQDPRAGFQDTWYAGTGESQGSIFLPISGSAILGNGIYKSTDNGLTWTPLTITQTLLEKLDNPFDLINNIVVNPANGHVYVACFNAIIRSTNGGTSWSTVKGSLSGNSLTANTDVAINNNGSKIYCSFHLRDTANRGVWQSTTGDVGTWVLMGGKKADVPTGWKVNDVSSSYWGRVLLKVAPSNDNIIYVMYENGLSQSSPNFKPEADLFKLDVTSGTPVWTNLSANMPDMPGNNKSGSDPIALQGGWNMLLSVKPDDANSVYVGGTNIYRSTSGFSNSTATSWIGGYYTDFSSNFYPNSHPDMHGLVFDPTNSKRAIALNDGGLQVTNDITASFVSWNSIKNYQTLQYYFVVLDPETGKNNFIGGAQDNGTWYRDATLNFGVRPGTRPGVNDFIEVLGGDGVAVDIAKINAGEQLVYLGAQSGILVRDGLINNASYPIKVIKPKTTQMVSDGSDGYGNFVTYFKLSNANSEVLMYANFYNLFRTTSASTVDSTAGWTKLTGISVSTDNGDPNNLVSISTVDFSWGTYQSTHAMYYGTDDGRIFRLNDYVNCPAGTLPKNITPTGLTAGSFVNDIAVNPNDDNEIMAVVSNYGVTSIWWTWNAKSDTPSWSNAEGNLTLPAVYSCAIVVKKDASNNPVTEYYVGTTVGLYATESIGKTLGTGGSKNIVWSREGAGTPNVLNYTWVTSLDYRPEDNTLLIGTHGNGMYYATIGSPNFSPNVATAIAAPVLNDKNFISIYPTVSRGNFQYGQGSMTGIKSIQIQVYNMTGQPVYQTLTNYGSGNIPLTNVASGTYVIQITSDNKKYQTLQKVIKQ